MAEREHTTRIAEFLKKYEDWIFRSIAIFGLAASLASILTKTLQGLFR